MRIGDGLRRLQTGDLEKAHTLNEAMNKFKEIEETKGSESTRIPTKSKKNNRPEPV